MDKQDKADLTIYDLRQRGNEVIAERDDAHEKLKAVRSEKSQLSSELQTVKAESRLYNEVCAMLERIAPDILRQAKEMVQAEKQREQQNISLQERKSLGAYNNRRNDYDYQK